MRTYISQGLHDIDRVSLGKTRELGSASGTCPGTGTHARTITIRTESVQHDITLFASDPKALEFKLEG